MIWVLSAIIILYALLIGAFTVGMRRLPVFEPDMMEADLAFSLIVVFRNEEANLNRLIQNLNELNYPKDKFEVLLINDASEDGSLDLVKSLQKELPGLNLRIFELSAPSSSPKKNALELGVRNASYEWIVTTDADCFLSKDYLMAYDQFLSVNSSEMIAGPVISDGQDSFLHRFQSLDFLSLQGATMGGFGGSGFIPFLRPFMCNGANLCYKKDTFSKLGGYSGNKELATGDDVFMLEKMLQKHADKVHFIKSRAALVRTKPKETWKGLVSQRVRWASKTSSYENRFAKFVGLLVFFANASLIFGLVLALLGFLNWPYLGVLFVLKLNADFLLIYSTASLWDQEKVMKSFVVSSFMYPFFSFWVAVKAMGGSYEWKGRSFKKGANQSSKE